LRDDLYYVVGGAALGAILGALGGWLFLRYRGKSRGGSLPSKETSLDKSKLMRLGWSVVRVIREVFELRS
jgi:hypothetical protein